ncbi:MULTISPECIES: hypothetical protein [Streptomycetaceae]|uniref:hypothetical protein n=1 Tax=Streptomycetaceae TaxID=2062 RepID=UPI001161195D|nr:hypothetical protein [Streptomyces sp. CB02056]
MIKIDPPFDQDDHIGNISSIALRLPKISMFNDFHARRTAYEVAMAIPEEMNTLRLRRLKILDEHHQAQEELRMQMATKLREVDHEARRLGGRSASLPCLVRITPGPILTIYHSADAPCGRVQYTSNFRRVTEAKAKDSSPYFRLERCTACHWGNAAKIHGQRLLNDS